MVNKLIKNEKDYENALSRIEGLMDAEPGTAEMDELELLTALVEMYEERSFPIDLPDPIEAIKFYMDQLGLSQKDIIPFIGNKSKVSEILNGKRTLTLAMMRSLNKGLGISPELLMREPGANFPSGIQDLDWSRFPVVEMAKRGWIHQTNNIKDEAEELVRNFINYDGNSGTIPSSIFRRHGTKGSYNPQMDRYSIIAWCIRILSIARQTHLKTKYKKESINIDTLREVARLSYFDMGPLLAKEYLEKHGIYLVIVPHLPKTYLDGAAMMLPSETPVIGLTIRYDRIDNFWFCLLHELAHVSMHLSTSDCFIVDDLDLRGKNIESDDIIEKEADEMACDGLIPNEVWEGINIKDIMTSADVSNLATELMIHPAIIAGRIRYEKNNYRLLSQYIGHKQVRKHFVKTFAENISSGDQ